MKGGANMAITNPLRYPGAKSKLAPYIKKVIETENLKGCVLYEPYAGSAAISLALLDSDTISKAVINELDPLIYHFWYSVMHDSENLITLINETDITLENWQEFSMYRTPEYLLDKTSLQIGFAGLFLNRTNFSGILNANPLGGMKQESQYTIDCRFNKDRIIKSIRKLSSLSDRIEIYNMDAIDFLKEKTKYKRNRKTFVYIDPPYYEKGPSLYRFSYDRNMHIQLAKYIKTKSYPWLISYDDQPEIRKLYQKNQRQHVYLDYSVHTHTLGKELLLSNLEIPPAESESVEEKLIG